MESKKGLDNIYIKNEGAQKVKIKNFSALRSHSIFLQTNKVACTWELEH